MTERPHPSKGNPLIFRDENFYVELFLFIFIYFYLFIFIYFYLFLFVYLFICLFVLEMNMWAKQQVQKIYDTSSKIWENHSPGSVLPYFFYFFKNNI